MNLFILLFIFYPQHLTASENTVPQGVAMQTVLHKMLASVPEYPQYLILDEIYAQMHTLRNQPGFTIETIGQSANGLPIEIVHYDGGYSKTVLLWGYEDPTEPVCALSMFWLCGQLRLRSPQLMRFQCNWAIIPTINPDGVQRNEEWFLAPGDMHAFLRGAWQPPYEQILYWNPSPECTEMAALQTAITTIKPDVLFDMHDESHFPAPGYQVFLSSPIDDKSMQAHLAYVTSQGMPLLDSPIMDPSYLRDPGLSVAIAYTVKPDCLVLIDEVCGYATSSSEVSDHRYLAPHNSDLLKAIDRYLMTLENMHHTDLALIESAKSHARHARERIAAGKNAAKALAVSCCGLRVMHSRGYAKDAEGFESIFWQYIASQDPPETHQPIPIQHQVRVQLHFLFTVLAQRGYLIPTAP